MDKGKFETEIDPELKRWQMLEIPITPDIPKAPNNTPEESFLNKYKNVVQENLVLKKKIRYSIDTIETLEKKVLYYENLYLKEQIKYLVLESQIDSSDGDSSDSSMNSYENWNWLGYNFLLHKMDDIIYNWSTQEISGISLAEQGYNSKTLRNAPPLSNYKEVNWEKLYLDADLELYFAQSKLREMHQKKGT